MSEEAVIDIGVLHPDGDGAGGGTVVSTRKVVQTKNRIIEVVNGQNLHDLCLQHYGSFDALQDLIEKNPNVITSVDFEPVEGMKLEVGEPLDKDIVEYYLKENIEIVSNREENDETMPGIFSPEFSEEFE